MINLVRVSAGSCLLLEDLMRFVYGIRSKGLALGAQTPNGVLASTLMLI